MNKATGHYRVEVLRLVPVLEDEVLEGAGGGAAARRSGMGRGLGASVEVLRVGAGRRRVVAAVVRHGGAVEGRGRRSSGRIGVGLGREKANVGLRISLLLS
ncbi:unnamed protein product [Urochloa humidicola]